MQCYENDDKSIQSGFNVRARYSILVLFYERRPTHNDISTGLKTLKIRGSYHLSLKISWMMIMMMIMMITMIMND